VGMFALPLDVGFTALVAIIDGEACIACQSGGQTQVEDED
jgi:hypothetical protein